MGRCEVCGNEYDKAFQVVIGGQERHTFDCFECAIHALAPSCAHCAHAHEDIQEIQDRVQ